MLQERERERRHRNLLAFSLLEVLIVIAIIGILSTVIAIKWQNMKRDEQIRTCRANILEIVSALEAYRVSNDFFQVYHTNKNGVSQVHPLDERMSRDLHLPTPTCPIGPVGRYRADAGGPYKDPNYPGGTVEYNREIGRLWYSYNWDKWMNTSYNVAFTADNKNYTITCMLHGSPLMGDVSIRNLATYSTLRHGFLNNF